MHDDLRQITPHFALWLHRESTGHGFKDLQDFMRYKCGFHCRLRVHTYRALKAHLVLIHVGDTSMPQEHRWRSAFKLFIEALNAGYRVPISLGRKPSPIGKKKAGWRLDASILLALQLASKQSGLPQSEIVTRALSLFFALENAIEESVSPSDDCARVDLD